MPHEVSKRAPKATFIPVTPRLARLIHEPGGITHEQALNDARKNLDRVRDQCLADIDAKLEVIHGKFGGLRQRPDTAELEEFYRLSNGIVATAGVFNMEALGRAAFSLCEVIDRLKSVEGWDWPAVELHLSGLKALRHAQPDDPVTSAVLEGLRKLTARVGHQR